jgi:hypothetical protein
MRKRRKIWRSQRGDKRRHNMAHTSGMLDKQGYMQTHIHLPTRPGTRTHAHTHTTNVYCFFKETMILKHASLLRYTYNTLYLF